MGSIPITGSLFPYPGRITSARFFTRETLQGHLPIVPLLIESRRTPRSLLQDTVLQVAVVSKTFFPNIRHYSRKREHARRAAAACLKVILLDSNQVCFIFE